MLEQQQRFRLQCLQQNYPPVTAKFQIPPYTNQASDTKRAFQTFRSPPKQTASKSEVLLEERALLRERIVSQRAVNEELRQQIKRDYAEYNRQIESTVRKIGELKAQYHSYEEEVKYLSVAAANLDQ